MNTSNFSYSYSTFYPTMNSSAFTIAPTENISTFIPSMNTSNFSVSIAPTPFNNLTLNPTANSSNYNYSFSTTLSPTMSSNFTMAPTSNITTFMPNTNKTSFSLSISPTPLNNSTLSPTMNSSNFNYSTTFNPTMNYSNSLNPELTLYPTANFSGNFSENFTAKALAFDSSSTMLSRIVDDLTMMSSSCEGPTRMAASLREESSNNEFPNSILHDTEIDIEYMVETDTPDYDFIVPLQTQILDTATNTALDCVSIPSHSEDERHRSHRSLESDHLAFSKVKIAKVDISDDCIPLHKAASYCYLVSCKLIISTLEDNIAPLQIEQNVLKSLKRNINYQDTSIPGLLFIKFDNSDEVITHPHNYNLQPVLFLIVFINILVLFLVKFRYKERRTDAIRTNSLRQETRNLLYNEAGVMT